MSVRRMWGPRSGSLPPPTHIWAPSYLPHLHLPPTTHQGHRGWNGGVGREPEYEPGIQARHQFRPLSPRIVLLISPAACLTPSWPSSASPQLLFSPGAVPCGGHLAHLSETSRTVRAPTAMRGAQRCLTGLTILQELGTVPILEVRKLSLKMVSDLSKTIQRVKFLFFFFYF